MCGIPFAGKSTVAGQIARRFGSTPLEVDRIVRERGFWRDGRRPTRAEWAASDREAYRRLVALLAAGTPIVDDATNVRRLQRDRVRRAAAPATTRVTIVWVDPSLAEIERRRRIDRLNPTRGDVHDADFAEVVASFQPPGPDEPFLRFDGSQRLAAWLARHRARPT